MQQLARWLLPLFIVLGWGVANARPRPRSPRGAPVTRKVLIETNPTGAAVFLNDKESDAIGTTPVQVELPIGDTTLIFERKGYKPTIKNITVIPGRGVIKQTFVLKVGQGGLEVKLRSDADNVAGIDIYLNGQKQGAPPLDLEVDAGSYQVVAKIGSRLLYQESVEVEVDGRASVMIRTKPAEAATTDTGDTGRNTAANPDATAADAETATTAIPNAEVIGGPRVANSPRPAYLEVSAGTTFLVRNVSYSQVKSSNLTGFMQRGQVMVGLGLQLWPLAGLSQGWLQRLSLRGQMNFGIPQTFDTTPVGTFTMKSRYRTLSAQVRYQIPLGSVLAVQVHGGWQQRRLGFTGASAGLELLPEAVLSSIPVGGGLLLQSSRVVATVSSHVHVAITGGPYIARFAHSRGTAFDVGAGFGIRGKHWHVNGSVDVTRHRWELTPGATYQADGATDQSTAFTLEAGFLW